MDDYLKSKVEPPKVHYPKWLKDDPTLFKLVNYNLDRADFDNKCREAVACLEQSVRQAVRLASTAAPADQGNVHRLWIGQPPEALESHVRHVALERAKQIILTRLLGIEF